ncbi:MAG: hypothetical protein IKO51_09315 [Clostridia bacterium]|nr:hypothetical protein [Clostridia bacterium]
MRQFITDIRRSVFSFRWLAAAVLIAGAVLTAVLTDSTYIETMRYFRQHGGALDSLFAHTVMAKALSNDMLLAVLPIAAALPFSTAVIEDVKSGYIKQYLPLVSKRSYAVSKLCSCALASVLAVTVGLGLVYFGIYAYHMPLQKAFELADEQRAAAELFGSNLEIMLRCLPAAALWSALALLAGTAGMNKFLAYISPFICYYVLVIIAERYFRDVLVLNPKNYITASGDWGGSPAVISSLTALAAMLAAYFAIAAKIDGNADRSGAHYSDKPIKLTERNRLRMPRKGILGDFSEVLTAARCNFSSWRTGPRIILTFAFTAILCFLLSNKVTTFAYTYRTTTQMFEPFVWTFGDSNSILLISLMLLLLFSDMPNLSAGVPYYLIRMKRRTWLLGQMLYMALVTVIYCCFVLAVTMLICMQNSFPGNMWSETAALLGYSGTGKSILLPVFVKTLEMSTPAAATGAIFVEMLLYSLLVGSILLLFNILKSRATGMAAVLAFSLYGYILNPQTLMTVLKLPDYMQYRANVIMGWISPLNHATYHMHNFGYDLLPTLAQSNLIFGGLILVLFVLTLLAIRRYSFSFTAGDSN